MKFKFIIIDDEPLARKLIASHASKIEGLEFLGECSNAIEASNLLRNKSVDLLFLDIQMPEIDGLKFIATLKNPPAIIVTTAYRDFGPEAFELDVLDYLLKPIRFERLLKSVNKFFDRQTHSTSKVVNSNDEETFIYVRAERKMHKITVAEILFVESLDEYVKIHLKNKMLITRENISVLEKKLSTAGFIRIHRSFLVSVKSVASIASDGVEISGKILPFGRAFKQSALAGLMIKP
ncbi:MAG TPA: LytTR family DNA-binding domain-containing protein [Chryseolinea sp.]|nr:LytTR family DNA-binding domain-containing protein [Chryseolinea sp.]